MKYIEKFENVHLKHLIMNLKANTDENGKLIGADLIFNPLNDNVVYHKSNGEVVPYFPENLTISLDMRDLIRISGLCLETLSSYLFNIRNKINSKDYFENINTTDPKRFIRVRVSSQFFRTEDKGRYKISIAIINKGNENIDDQELVNLNFSKRDVVILSSLLRRITSSYNRIKTSTIEVQYVDKETNEIVETGLSPIAKVDSSLHIADTWFHGQELLNIMYTVEKLIYSLHIEKELGTLNSIYRQTMFTHINDIEYFVIKKMNSDNGEVPIIKEGKECFIRIPCSNQLLSMFFLFLDVSILKHAEFEDDESIEILGSTKVNLGDKVKYHISMKESFLGIAIKPRKKSDESKISLVGKTKDGVFKEENDHNDILENYIKKYDADGNKVIVPVLSSFQIDLKDQWHKLIMALSIAYTKEYEEYSEGRTWNLVKFFVVNQDNTGKYKYEFTIFADKGNKAPAVLIIEKYKVKAGNELEFVGRYRQPLFEKYLYQLISIALTASEEIENIELLEDINLKSTILYQYKSMKKIKEIKKDKLIRYGFKRKEDVVLIGDHEEESSLQELDIQDISLLNLSAFSRLTKGMWIPFSGKRVCIGQDGFLTDMNREINMDGNKKGTYWGTKIFFGTSL